MSTDAAGAAAEAGLFQQNGLGASASEPKFAQGEGIAADDLHRMLEQEEMDLGAATSS